MKNAIVALVAVLSAASFVFGLALVAGSLHCHHKDEIIGYTVQVSENEYAVIWSTNGMVIPMWFTNGSTRTVFLHDKLNHAAIARIDYATNYTSWSRVFSEQQ